MFSVQCSVFQYSVFSVQYSVISVQNRLFITIASTESIESIASIESITSTESTESIHRKRSAQIEKWNGNPKLSGGGKVNHIVIAFHCTKWRIQKTAACVGVFFTGL